MSMLQSLIFNQFLYIHVTAAGRLLPCVSSPCCTQT